MAYLLDSGILLRLVDKADRQHDLVRRAVGALGNRGENLAILTQNVAEFCNVATRPLANNGLAMTPTRALELLEFDVEPLCSRLSEPADVYQELKRLIAKFSVTGKQVHDARLVATMLVWRVENILTLNDRDFRRYEPEGVRIVTPQELVATS
jgi:predicted nucleic acid-binding protein